MLLESSSRAAGFLVFCLLLPQTTKPLWSTRGISQLLRLSCKSTSQRLQTDTQRSRAWPPARVARQESFPRESSGQSCSSSQQGCKSQLTAGMDLAGDNNPCPEWGSSYPSPASSFWGAASPGCQQSAGPALGLLLQAAPPGSPLLWRGAGVPSAAAGTWHQTCLKRLSSAGHLPQAAGKARLTILWV